VTFLFVGGPLHGQHRPADGTTEYVHRDLRRLLDETVPPGRQLTVYVPGELAGVLLPRAHPGRLAALLIAWVPEANRAGVARALDSMSDRQIVAGLLADGPAR